MTDDPVQTIVSALHDLGCDPRGSGSSFTAKCPAHEDSSPSLSVKRGDDGRVLVCCHAGCRYTEVMRAVGLSSRDGFMSTRSDGQPRRRGERSASRYHREAPLIDWTPFQDRFEAQASDSRVSQLAAVLGVSSASLRSLRVGYATQADIDNHLGLGYPVAQSDSWTFPMRDAAGRIIGINTRPVGEGSKRTMRGGKLGLFFPDDILDRQGVIWLVEGASDAAAALTAGYPAVGRPSAKAGKTVVSMIADLLKGREVVAVGENDRKKNGKWPGREGAVALARDLGRAWKCEPPMLAMPPAGTKDTRDWLRQSREQGTIDDGRVDQETATE